MVVKLTAANGDYTTVMQSGISGGNLNGLLLK